MEYVRTRDILEKAREFHKNLSEFFAMESPCLDNKLVGLVLNYFSKHERLLAEEILNFEKDANPDVLGAWFKYAPDTLEELMETNVEIPTDADVNDVVLIALRLDDKLIEFYRSVAESAQSVHVRELFENLLEEELMAERRLVRNALAEF